MLKILISGRVSYPRINAPSERNITEKDILAFLDEDTAFDIFKETLGESNAEIVPYASYAYELEGEGDEKRYADVHIDNRQDRWLIARVTIVKYMSNMAISTLCENLDR